MARFRYRMQSILDIKLKMETQARQEFAFAKIRLDEEEEKLRQLESRRASYEEQGRVLMLGGLRVQDIIDNKTAIIHMEERITGQKIQVRIAEQKLEQARDRLQEVMQERKTHETLKEKAFEEFLKEENQKESKEIDQLTSYVYGRKAGEK